MLPAARFLLSLTLLFSAAACGEPTRLTQSLPTTPTPNISPSQSPSQSPSPSPTPTGWKTYSASDFGFTIEYPPNFLFEEFEPPHEAGQLANVRFFDQVFAEKYPDGQIGLDVYAKDASSLEAWLEKHASSTTDESEDGIYYPQVSAQTPTTTNGGDSALAFEWEAVTIGTIHEIAFFSGQRIITLSWYGKSSYEAIFDQMLNSYQE